MKSTTSHNLDKVWKSALRVIKEEVPFSSFQAWIKTANLVSIENNKAIIEVRNEFSKNLLVQNYHRSISKGLETALGKSVDLTVKVNSQLKSEDYIPSLSSLADSLPSRPIITTPSASTNNNSVSIGEISNNNSAYSIPHSNLNPKFVFDTFIVGGHNQFCHAAALAIAEKRSQGAYNPFFIYGGVGLGKTHIMQAIGNHILSRNPNAKVLYLTAEKFLNDLINSMRKSKMNEFRSRYRSLDLLLIDDIQFIEGKETTQEEFFHTFNALKDNGSQIVMTSDRPPKGIPRLEPRLCSRFEGGLVADVQAPTYETRLAILSRKAEELKIKVKPEIADLIAKAFYENVRTLEGALVKLHAFLSFTGKSLSVEMVEQVLHISSADINKEEQSIKETPSVPPEEENIKKKNGKSNGKARGKGDSNDKNSSNIKPAKFVIEKIVELVSSKTKITVEQITGRDNSRKVLDARQMCMTIARSNGISLNQISDFFGGKSNSSILNACQRVDKQAQKDTKLQKIIDEVKTEIKPLIS